MSGRVKSYEQVASMTDVEVTAELQKFDDVDTLISGMKKMVLLSIYSANRELTPELSQSVNSVLPIDQVGMISDFLEQLGQKPAEIFPTENIDHRLFTRRAAAVEQKLRDPDLISAAREVFETDYQLISERKKSEAAKSRRTEEERNAVRLKKEERCAQLFDEALKGMTPEQFLEMAGDDVPSDSFMIDTIIYYYYKCPPILDIITNVEAFGGMVTISRDAIDSKSFYGYDIMKFFKIVIVAFKKFMLSEWGQINGAYAIGCLREQLEQQNVEARMAAFGVFYYLMTMNYDFEETDQDITRPKNTGSSGHTNVVSVVEDLSSHEFEEIVSDQTVMYHGITPSSAFAVVYFGFLPCKEFFAQRNDFGIGIYLTDRLGSARSFGNNTVMVVAVKNFNPSLGHFSDVYSINSHHEVKLKSFIRFGRGILQLDLNSQKKPELEDLDQLLDERFARYNVRDPRCLTLACIKSKNEQEGDDLFGLIDERPEEEILDQLSDPSNIQNIVSVNLNGQSYNISKYLPLLSCFENLQFVSMKNCFDFSGNSVVDLTVLPRTVKYLFIDNNKGRRNEKEKTIRNFRFDESLEGVYVSGKFLERIQNNHFHAKHGNMLNNDEEQRAEYLEFVGGNPIEDRIIF